jgi:1-acyl-sn-glycerol-3-phosphate acyltransferase
MPIPLQLSRNLMGIIGISVSLHNLQRISTKNEFLIASNHRSLADALLLMTATSRPVRFDCHHYTSQVPLLLQTIDLLDTFPLEADQRKQSPFFWQSP